MKLLQDGRPGRGIHRCSRRASPLRNSRRALLIRGADGLICLSKRRVGRLLTKTGDGSLAMPMLSQKQKDATSYEHESIKLLTQIENSDVL